MTKRFQNTKRYFMCLRKKLKESGAQIVLPSIFPGGGVCPRQLDKWEGWMTRPAPVQGFGVFDLGHAFKRPGILADGEHLTKWGTSVMGSKLAGLMNEALN